MAENGRWLDDTQQLAWQGLLTLINRALPEIERTFKAHDLLSVQYGILVALAEAPDQTLRLSDLADRANTSQSRLTHRLRGLVAHGDIEITDDSIDGRAKNATLTGVGRRRSTLLAALTEPQWPLVPGIDDRYLSPGWGHERIQTANPRNRN